MTFESDDIRILYHTLPTETQVLYSEMEERLAKKIMSLHIEDVIIFTTSLEVVIRITDEGKGRSACSGLGVPNNFGSN